MKAKTRLFGDIEIEEEKIIVFEQGIIGFPEMKHFTLIFDMEKKEETAIMWLQSMDESEFALPVMSPESVMPEYSPTVGNEFLDSLGELKVEDVYLLVTVTVPSNIEEIAINLKAPIVINVSTNKASQMIVEDDYPIKYKIYNLIKDSKKKAGE